MNEILFIDLSFIKRLINLSVFSSKFPSHVNVAITFFLYTKGKKLITTNFRSISILSVISKIFERIIDDTRFNVLNTFGLISDCQHAHQDNKSVRTARCDLLEQIYIRYEWIINFLTNKKIFIEIDNKLKLIVVLLG